VEAGEVAARGPPSRRGRARAWGLSICYAIVSRHKGRIQVDSELGKGTTFTVRLPLTEE
jgi:sensor histidine kinase regulating citrate/malate metabolism